LIQNKNEEVERNEHDKFFHILESNDQSHRAEVICEHIPEEHPTEEEEIIVEFDQEGMPVNDPPEL
jgi:hypothetical protein